MSRIGNMMSVGKQSLANSQSSLQTTTHNVANANTEGYTRQRVEVQTNTPISEGRLRIGQGAKPVMVTRVVNNFLTKQIQEETTKLGTANGRDEPLKRVEQIYNESVNKGLNQFLSNFFNSFREFANNPESQATRALVKENAKFVTEDFHRVHDQLNNIQKDIDAELDAKVSQINGFAKEIADLNQKIAFVEIQGMKANDERDRRELILKKLGEMVNVRYGENDVGQVSVTVGNTAVMVSGSEYNSLHARRTPEEGNKREGNVDIFFKNGDHGSEFRITNELKSGQFGGLIETRDQVINGLHDNMDHIAYTVMNAVNTVHQQGYDRYNNTNSDFFKPLEKERDAAAYIAVDDKILHDPGFIAHGLVPDAPGDNRIANAIAGLQMQKLFKDGTTSVDDYYNGIVGELGVVTQKNNMFVDHQKHIVDQLNNVRETISGVSLDEETTDMVKFQKAFDASARIIKVADEMLETVLNLKRL